jgi:hypothetical protein
MATTPVYFEMVDFMINKNTPEEILDWHPSEEAEERVRDLIAKEHDGAITEQERLELDDQMNLEHIMRLIKARAIQVLASRASS